MELEKRKAAINKQIDESYEDLELFDETAELLINNSGSEIIVRKIIALHHKLQDLYELSLINNLEICSYFENEIKKTE